MIPCFDCGEPEVDPMDMPRYDVLNPEYDPLSEPMSDYGPYCPTCFATTHTGLQMQQ